MVNEAPGSAHLILAGNVVHLDPAPAMSEAMIEGWTRQQRSRFLKDQTIAARIRMIRRFSEFTNLYPWQWTPAEAEAWISDLRSGDRALALSTIRSYEITVRLFCEYLTDNRYGWMQVCADRFGSTPQLVFHEGNSVLHIGDYEGSPRRRPLTYDEIQALFDAADGRAEKIRADGRKGALAAMRDSAMLKFCYAFGLRRSEVCNIDLVDLRRNPQAPQYGSSGSVAVRFGKASRGGPAKRRTVLTVPEFDWIVDVVEHYLTEIRPAFAPGAHPALWVTERAGRISPRSVNAALTAARDDANLDPILDLHCLRHSYVTHLIEFDYPVRFVQEQVGHAHASTTSIYTGVSNEYRNQLLTRAMRNRHGELWSES